VSGIAAVAGENPIDWEWLRARLAEVRWSTQAREVGLWALSRLEREFGPGWPEAWRRPGAAPPEILACGWALAGLCGCLEMALAFERLEGVEGIAKLRRQIATGLGPARLASPRLQLTQASLARAAGYQVRLEAKLAGARTALDLEISGEEGRVGIEAFALLRDERTLAASTDLDRLRETMRVLGEAHRLDFRGAIEEPLAEEELCALEADLPRYVNLAALGAALGPLRVGPASISVEPAEGPGGASHMRLPTVPFGRRLAGRLAQKARQALGSGADWLAVDSLDHLWHLSGWADSPLEVKAAELSALVRAELAEAEHILGVTITDGAALMRPAAVEETHELPWGTALVRRPDAWHVRESVVIVLRPGAESAAAMWRSILDQEAGRLGRELARVGLAVPPELAVVAGGGRA
jgi:hypothetical protein